MGKIKFEEVDKLFSKSNHWGDPYYATTVTLDKLALIYDYIDQIRAENALYKSYKELEDIAKENASLKRDLEAIKAVVNNHKCDNDSSKIFHQWNPSTDVLRVDHYVKPYQSIDHINIDIKV